MAKVLIDSIVSVVEQQQSGCLLVSDGDFYSLFTGPETTSPPLTHSLTVFGDRLSTCTERDIADRVEEKEEVLKDRALFFLLTKNYERERSHL